MEPYGKLKRDLTRSMETVAELRSSVLTEILRLPAPGVLRSPLRSGLEDVDRRLATVELELISAVNALPEPLPGWRPAPRTGLGRILDPLGLFTR